MTGWAAERQVPDLALYEAHVWRASVSSALKLALGGDVGLSNAEHERRATFRFKSDAERFSASHLLLRWALAGYLDLTPSEVRIRYQCFLCGGKHGKPRLEGPSGQLDFSISRRGDCVLVAVARGVKVGIDVEAIKDIDATALSLALSETEKRERCDASRIDCGRHLLSIWSLKEAYLKAIGQGLTQSPDSLTVMGPSPEGNFHILDSEDHASKISWRLSSIPLAQDYVSAIATSLSVSRIELKELTL
jgi:4'-phosphopantetheinyl transferase